MTYSLFAVFSPAIAVGAAVAAVGVPLVVHLLFRKRYQIVPWAAMRFLLVAERRHKRRIDQWLLLILRTGALALFLLAMIAPTEWAEKLWQAIKPGATERVSNVPRTHHVIVLDSSLSMNAKVEPGQPETRFERALAQAENLIRSSNPGDGFTILKTTNDSDKVVVQGPSNEPDKVVAELRKVKPTHGPADHAVGLNTIADVLTRSPRAYPRRQLTFFTDLQRASWTNAIPREGNTTKEIWERILARADVAVVDTARRDAENLAVAELTLSESMPLVGQSVVATVTVANLGMTEKKDVRVSLHLEAPSGGGPSRVDFEPKSIDVLPPGGRGQVKFDIGGTRGFLTRGVYVVQAKVVDHVVQGERVVGDDLPADDSRALAVEVRDGLHALLIEGKADPDWRRRAASYLDNALFPTGAKPSHTPARPRVVSPTEFLDPNLCDLANADGRGSPVDCIFVCDVFNPTPDLAAKLDAMLRRGGTVIFVLGPNAAASREQYNAVLYRDGNGVLPGPLGEAVTLSGPDDLGFRFHADDEEFHKLPLAPFGSEKRRGELINVPFRGYVKLDVPEGRGRRVLSFVRPGTMTVEPKDGPKPKAAKPDPALVEWTRHRGRVCVFTSAVNEDWSYWPSSSSFLELWHEFLRYSVANPDRHTLRIGEPIEEFFPASAAGLIAGLHGPKFDDAPGKTTLLENEALGNLQLQLQNEAGVAVYKNTNVRGLYRLGINGSRDRLFAVNVPEIVAGMPNESDLRRINGNEFKAVGTVQLVTDPTEVTPTGESGAVVTTKPKNHGPMIARYAVLLAVLVLATELLLAWHFGPSRTGAANSGSKPGGKWLLRLAGTLATLLPLVIAAFAIFTVIHAERTGNPLGFLPHDLRESIEKTANVPVASPGEGTKWRFETVTAFLRNTVHDRRLVLSLAVLCVAITVGTYWMERRAASGFTRVVVPMFLRIATFLLALFILLPQLQLAFDREGLPEVVIVLDTSASMDQKASEIKDPAVRAKAEELAGTTNLSEINRLRLAQMLLTRKDADWLDRLLKEKQVKVHLYAVDKERRMLTAIEEESQLPEGRDAIEGLKADADGSHLGDCVEAILKDFRGKSLAALIMFTDGVTTAGDNLPQAARAAALDGVPLFLVGIGDTWETPDLALTDLQAEDVVGRGDKLVFEARLTAHGEVPSPVTVFLREKMPGGKLEDRGQATITPGPPGNPVIVTIAYTPMETGSRIFVLEVPGVPGETNLRNNRIERPVLVTESRRIRVLYVEGYPRYDFRFVKVMLERESDKSLGGKSVEVQVVLLDASKGWPETDRSAFRGEFPTRTELFGFDVVVLGDVDPKHIGGTRAAVVLRDLADFVKVKGGGLMFLCGEHGTPAAYADTPLAEVLPVVPSDAPVATRPPEEQPILDEYQPRLTPAGKIHPLFRFAPDEAESARIWGNLKPLFWYAKGYRRKPLSNVLATHPTKSAESGVAGEFHPLVIQQFAGAGPVLFVGFDDTWRWRFRSDEEHFDRFWMQAMRVLSRSRNRQPELRVVSDRTQKVEFRSGEKVTVQVIFPIEAPSPAGDAPVRVSVTRKPLPNTKGNTETATLVLNRVQGAAGQQYEATLPRAPEGEYYFELTDPEVPGTRPSSAAYVLPPMNERDRTELNRAELIQAATVSGGGFYTLANANDVFNDLKNLQRVPLNKPCDPVSLWNQPAVYALIMFLLLGEWLLRKRERLL